MATLVVYESAFGNTSGTNLASGARRRPWEVEMGNGTGNGRRRSTGSGGNRKGTKQDFGSIRQLPSGRYQARFTGPDRRQHKAPRTFVRKGEARAWLATQQASIITGSWRAPLTEAPPSVTFADYARSWLGSRHELRPSTVASYRASLERHLVPAFGDSLLDEITTAEVRTWFASYGARTPTARAHAYSLFALIMADAQDEGLVAVTPSRIRAGGRTRVRREPEVLTLPELLALAAAMPLRHRSLTLLCGLTGLRIGEALALRRRDVDLHAGTVTVVRTAVRVDGRMTTNEPKTRAGARTVHIPGMLVDELRRHMSELPHRGRDALVFPSDSGGLQGPSSVYGNKSRTIRLRGKSSDRAGYGFLRAREVIGRPNLLWHDLRRTAATLAAQQGATVREIQGRLGHSTPTMALHYQQTSADRDRAIAERLQEELEAARTSGDTISLR